MPYWHGECTYKTQIKKVQIKQNTVIRVIFFAITYGQNTESALPFMRLLDILDVESLYKLQILKFAYLWQRNELPDIFHDYFQFACDVHSYNTRYATRKNFYKPRTRTNIGKQSRAFFNYITGGGKPPPSPHGAPPPPLNHFGPPSQSPFSLKYKQNMEFRRDV